MGWLSMVCGGFPSLSCAGLGLDLSSAWHLLLCFMVVVVVVLHILCHPIILDFHCSINVCCRSLSLGHPLSLCPIGAVSFPFLLLVGMLFAPILMVPLLPLWWLFPLLPLMSVFLEAVCAFPPLPCVFDSLPVPRFRWLFSFSAHPPLHSLFHY